MILFSEILQDVVLFRRNRRIRRGEGKCIVASKLNLDYANNIATFNGYMESFSFIPSTVFGVME